MAETFDSRDLSSYSPGKQQLDINNARITGSQIGGQASRDMFQAGRDVVSSTTILNFSRDEDVEFLLKKHEASLKAQFRERLEQISKLIASLQKSLTEQLSLVPIEDKSQVLKILTELRRLTGYKSALENIQDKLRFCVEASLWLNRSKERIASYVTDKVLNGSANICDSKPRQYTPSEILEERFSKDIVVYLTWLVYYLQRGEVPSDDFNKEWVFLDFDSSAYKAAFSAITTDLIDPHVSKLSIDVAETAASYINRFLIDEEGQSNLFYKDALKNL